MAALSQPPAPFLIDCDGSSLTICWSPYPSSTLYHLQHRATAISPPEKAAGASKDEDDDWTLGPWSDLAATFAATQVKKKNLQATHYHEFRYRPRDAVDYTAFWSAPSTPFFLPSGDASKEVVSPQPTMKTSTNPADAIGGSVAIQWEKVEEATAYSISMRCAGEPFATIGKVGALEVRKKNLDPKKTYFFQIAAVVDEAKLNGRKVFPSKSSDGLKPAPLLSDYFLKLFEGLPEPKMLLSKGGDSGKELVPASLAASCGPSKITLLYFSAHWCPPCRQFTPMLANFYKQFSASQNFEVVFVSCDHDEKEFKSYYLEEMPWKTLPYEDDRSVRESVTSKFSVRGIPMLVVLGGNGEVIDENAVKGGQLTEETAKGWWRTLKEKQGGCGSAKKVEGGHSHGGGGCCGGGHHH